MTAAQSKRSILIVEDEPFLVEMYRARFEQDGYTVYIALNGTPVMSLIQKHKPDLILLDIVMPEKDGYEVLRELKANKQTKHIPVLIFSNLAQDNEIRKGMKLGADDYFVKSDYTPTQLVAKVTAMIRNAKKKTARQTRGRTVKKVPQRKKKK